jgi:hypothetical protein
MMTLAVRPDLGRPAEGAPMETTGNPNGTTDPDRLAARLIEGLPVTTRRLDIDGVSTSLIEGGEGPPMVLVHGQGGFAEIMAPLIRCTVACVLEVALGDVF